MALGEAVILSDVVWLTVDEFIRDSSIGIADPHVTWSPACLSRDPTTRSDIKGGRCERGELAPYPFFTHPFFVSKLASHPSIRASVDTAVDQSVAYATGTGEVTVGGYHAWGPIPVVERMMVSGRIFWEAMMKC